MRYLVYYNFIFSMNFCQKHQNHHCVHAHQCENPQHQKHIEKKSLQNHNKTIGSIQQRKRGSQTCIFTKSGNLKSSKQINEELLKQLHDKQIKICQLGHEESALKQKNDKLLQENKHLYTQIEYYRQQFASLIQNSNQDNKNEIKKRVKETTNFMLKVNSLQNENNSLKIQNNRLKDQIEAQRLLRNQNKHINENIQEKYNDVHTKLRILDKEKEQFKEQAQGKSKQYNRLKENYQILKKQFANDSQKLKKTVRQLTLQLQLTKKELSKLKGSTEKERQLLNIQISNHTKRQEALKQKLDKFQANNRDLFESIKELKNKNEQLQENLYHAKKIIDKNQENTHQFANLQKELNEKNVQTHTIIKEHRQSFSSNKQNKQIIKETEDTTALHEEIKTLKQKIIELQKRNMTNFEEIILNMGASQAFKKLLQEKNTIIKKLMREKGQIYAKLVISHQH